MIKKILVLFYLFLYLVLFFLFFDKDNNNIIFRKFPDLVLFKNNLVSDESERDIFDVVSSFRNDNEKLRILSDYESLNNSHIFELISFFYDKNSDFINSDKYKLYALLSLFPLNEGSIYHYLKGMHNKLNITNMYDNYINNMSDKRKTDYEYTVYVKDFGLFQDKVFELKNMLKKNFSFQDNIEFLFNDILCQGDPDFMVNKRFTDSKKYFLGYYYVQKFGKDIFSKDYLISKEFKILPKYLKHDPFSKIPGDYFIFSDKMEFMDLFHDFLSFFRYLGRDKFYDVLDHKTCSILIRNLTSNYYKEKNLIKWSENISNNLVSIKNLFIVYNLIIEKYIPENDREKNNWKSFLYSLVYMRTLILEKNLEINKDFEELKKVLILNEDIIKNLKNSNI